MPQIDPVILQLRADVARYRNELRSTVTIVDRQLDQQERAFRDLERQVRTSSGAIGSTLNRVGALFAGVSTAVLVREYLRLADASKALDAQLRLATSNFGTLAQAQEDVSRIARETRSGLSEITALYGGFIRASAETGRTQDEAARATQTFAQALKIGGAGANEAASATLQFNQALQSGVLRGDEFNSILEASPRIARLLAEALGVPIGQLRSMAEQGKITSDVLFSALTDRRFTARIDAEFKQLPTTFGEAMTAIENAAVTTIGAFDKGGRFSNALVNFLTTGTDAFSGLEQAASDFGIETRAVFDGLSDVFDPLLAGAQGVFGGIRAEANYTRDAIASILSGYDQLNNFLVDIDNRARSFDNTVKRGLNRAISRSASAGGRTPVLFQERALAPRSDVAGQFVRSFNGSTAAAQARLAADREAARRAAPARPRPRSTAAPATPAPRGRQRTGSAATEDVVTAAELIAAINKDLRDIAAQAGSAMLAESERLERAAQQFESVFGREGADFTDPFAGVADYDRQRGIDRDLMEEAERDAQFTREANVRSLAGLYEDLFTRGTDEVWRNFKDQGLRTLAIVLAQATITSLAKGGGGLGSLLGNIGKAAGSLFGGGSLFGRASGGYVGPGQTVRVNEQRPGVELLRMGPQGGTVIPLGQTQAMRPNAGVTVQQTIHVDGRNSVTPAGFARDILTQANDFARQAAGEAGRGAVKAAPGAVAQARRFGAT